MDEEDEDFEEVELVAKDGTSLGKGYRFKPHLRHSWYPSVECIAGMISEAC